MESNSLTTATNPPANYSKIASEIVAIVQTCKDCGMDQETTRAALEAFHRSVESARVYGR